MAESSAELLKELAALRVEIQALPDRIVAAASKEIKREARIMGWTLVACILLGAAVEWLRANFWK